MRRGRWGSRPRSGLVHFLVQGLLLLTQGSDVISHAAKFLQDELHSRSCIVACLWLLGKVLLMLLLFLFRTFRDEFMLLLLWLLLWLLLFLFSVSTSLSSVVLDLEGDTLLLRSVGVCHCIIQNGGRNDSLIVVGVIRHGIG